MANSLDSGNLQDDMNTKRAGLGEQRTTTWDTLMRLLRKKHEYSESGLESEEDTERLEELKMEISYVTERRRHLHKEESIRY